MFFFLVIFTSQCESCIKKFDYEIGFDQWSPAHTPCSIACTIFERFFFLLSDFYIAIHLLLLCHCIFVDDIFIFIFISILPLITIRSLIAIRYHIQIYLNYFHAHIITMFMNKNMELRTYSLNQWIQSEYHTKIKNNIIIRVCCLEWKNHKYAI